MTKSQFQRLNIEHRLSIIDRFIEQYREDGADYGDVELITSQMTGNGTYIEWWNREIEERSYSPRTFIVRYKDNGIVPRIEFEEC